MMEAVAAACTWQQSADSPNPKLPEFPVNPRGAPEWIRGGHLTNQDADVVRHRQVAGDGEIRMDRIEGKLDLDTEDGSITLEAKPTALKARTSDGSIRMEVEPDTAMTDDWDLQTPTAR